MSELGGTGRGEAARLEVGWGVRDKGSRSSELDVTGSRDVGRREVEWGVGDEVSDVGSSPKVNDEVRSAKSVSSTSIVEAGGDANGKTFSTNLT